MENRDIFNMLKIFLISLIFYILFNKPSVSNICRKEEKNCLLEYKEDSGQESKYDKNLNGSRLQVCSKKPLTGFMRTGFCSYSPQDRGSHLVCAEVSEEFLEYTKSMGNDLTTPSLRYGFPGLRPGDRWCLCTSRVIEAKKYGIRLKIIDKATNIKSGL